MRIIALLFVAACVMATSVQAQDGHNVAVSHGHNSFVSHGQHHGTYAGANIYGCCENDVSHCFDAWANYCSERKPHGACLLGKGCRTGACGCNDHCGIFQNKPCCGPKFSFKRKHFASSYETCAEPGCATGDCDSGFVEHAPPGEAVEDEIQTMPAEPIDTARYPGSEQITPAANAVVQPAASTNPSAGRWYLPYKWKK